MIKIFIAIALLVTPAFSVLLKQDNFVKKLVDGPISDPANFDRFQNPKDRKLFLEEANMPQGNVYVEQLQNTNSNLNEMQAHSRRQTEMKSVGQWFTDVDERIDDFRDAVSRKLNEFHMALQRPKIPIAHPMGVDPMMAAQSMMAMNSQGASRQGSMTGSMAPDEEPEEPEDEEEEEEEERRRMKARHL